MQKSIHPQRLTRIALGVLVWWAIPTVSAIAQVAIQTAAPVNLSAGGDPPTLESKSLLGIIRDGGLVMYPLFACSFMLLVFAFERFISLRTGRVIPRPFVKRVGALDWITSTMVRWRFLLFAQRAPPPYSGACD